MVYITSLGSFLPGEVITNDKIEDVLGRPSDIPSRAKNIVLRSNGIKGRYYALDPVTKKPTHTNAELTALAINQALKNTDFEKSGVDLIACGTTCPDQFLPSHASMVQGELKLNSAEVISTAGVCCSSMAALKYAYLSILSGDKQTAIATGSEISSKFMRAQNFEKERIEELKKSEVYQFEQDFLRWMLSDGAGAFLLENKPRGLSLKIEWIDFKSYANELPTCMYGGAKKDENGKLKSWLDYDRKDLVNDQVLNISQDTKLLDKYVAEYCVSKTLHEIKVRRGLMPGDVDWFVPHYSSGYFREIVFEHLNKIDFHIPYDKWATSIESKGNIGSASFFIYLDDLMKSGQVKAGQKILGLIPESSRFSAAYILLTATEA
jgi:3-oxoacyl-[acyl-carrier-protein] synthase-3